ncbi:DUF4406 domain-containing protein [Porphyromonas cangingivalis]|uniref:DUF4406 domain-containing protein n=1 Tax=Porphyromonas cangingivalis TaxID=36874 RepID=UPI00242E5779|nr:DUF4406 domain-containing protein [Porphyromonas cangingivalis]
MKKHREGANIYISGGISGRNKEEVERQFCAAENQLREMLFNPINPLRLTNTVGLSWEDYMRIDIKALMDCEAICMLNGWEESKGARLEFHIAQSLGMHVFFIGI